MSYYCSITHEKNFGLPIPFSFVLPSVGSTGSFRGNDVNETGRNV